MPLDGYTYQTIDQFIGKEIGVSNWLTIEQDRVNQFADCTGDHQWTHVDIERARNESPFGAPIAHGFLTLSLLSYFQADLAIVPTGVAQVINYGLDKVRFLTPVKVGQKIRNRSVIVSAEDKPLGKLVKTQNTVEIEGEDKPAMIAETLMLMMPGG